MKVLTTTTVAICSEGIKCSGCGREFPEGVNALVINNDKSCKPVCCRNCIKRTEPYAKLRKQSHNGSVWIQ